MALLSTTGGVSLDQADELRAAIVASGGEETVLGELERQFLATAERAGADQGAAGRAWKIAARFAAYSFNKAHAASYGTLAYYSAYMKAHFPVEFACAALNHHQGLYPLRTLAAEFARLGVNIHPPHVNRSCYQCRVLPTEGPGESYVSAGLGKIRGLTRSTAESMIKNRSAHGPFSDLADVLNRVRLTKGEVAALVLSGACDRLAPLVPEEYPFPHEAILEYLRQGGNPAGLGSVPIPRPAAADEEGVRLYRALVRVRNELRYLEMHLSGHPAALLRPEARRYGCRTIAESTDAATGGSVRLETVVAAMRRVATPEGIVQFVTLEDETGLMEGVIIPAVYRSQGNRITSPGPFLVEGSPKRRYGVLHLEISSVSPFHQRTNFRH